MRRRTIRIIIILAMLSMAGIIITQVYWVRKQFDLNKEEFDFKVNLSLKNVAQAILDYNGNKSKLVYPVNQVASNYFAVNVNDHIDANILEYHLKLEFEKYNIIADFQYTIYDCYGKKVVYESFISKEGEKAPITQRIDLPKWENENYFFTIYFPSKNANIVSQMGVWIFSTTVLLIVLVFFGISIFIIIKQERLSTIQKDFINNMTHEFKTPISTISISSEILKNPNIIKTPERLNSYATIIQDEAMRLKNQVERVLQMATLDREEIKLKLEVLDAHEVIIKSVQNIQPSLIAQNAEINYALQATRHLINADKLHFTNIIFNLVDNATKYCKEVPKVSIITKSDQENFYLLVKDNGIGINAENKRKIFDKFYRVPTGNVHDVKGFGLGLNYVKIMMKAHKGSISVESEPGQGATFILQFPLKFRQ